MKKLRLFILLASFILGLLAVCWSRAQTPSHRLKVIDDKGVEHHTLMSDQYNVLVEHLEAAGQTNAIELFRQYRCAYNADLSASSLRNLVAALRGLREGRKDEAIQLLEQQLAFHASMMCNSYGCLSPTNRARVNVEQLEKTRDYYAKFPPSESSSVLEKAINEVLRVSSEKLKE